MSFFKILHVNISILVAGKKDFSIIVDENYEGITDHVFLNICDLVSWTSEFGQFPCVRTSDINIFFEWKLLFHRYVYFEFCWKFKTWKDVGVWLLSFGVYSFKVFWTIFKLNGRKVKLFCMVPSLNSKWKYIRR